ncbi:zincin-like metallopeptidase domain-containing protein, partial [Vibrio mediterranei]
ATLTHELTHWSGNKNRLNRLKNKKFGSRDYAFEELVAELGSAFLMAEFGFTGELQHASYIESWLQALGKDKTY